jgi:DeoR family fructose operon transcriptional repressor
LSFQRGLTTPYHDESVLKRAMIDSARRIVASVDSSKFGNDQMFAYGSLDEIDVLVTDTGVGDDALTVLSEHELEVRCA